VSETFPSLIEKRLFDELRLWDNDVPRGSPPRLILEQKNGRTTVYDEAAYWDFLAKSSKYAERDKGWRLIDGVPIPIEVKKGRLLYDLTKAAGEDTMVDSEELRRIMRAILNDRTWAEFIAVAPKYDTAEHREAWDEIVADVKAMEEQGMMPVAPLATEA
jgi:hypothetical protein